MKKLVDIALAPQDSDVLFSLRDSVSGKLDASSAIKIIQRDSYRELMRGKEREGVIVYLSKTEYEDLKKQNKID